MMQKSEADREEVRRYEANPEHRRHEREKRQEQQSKKKTNRKKAQDRFMKMLYIFRIHYIIYLS